MATSAFIIFFIDFASKALALKYLADSPVKVIGNFVKFSLTFNKGAAFSLATNRTIFLSVFAMFVVALILFMGTRITSTIWALALGIVLAGVLGNLSDRIFRSPGGLQGAVVDWISVGSWPTFNIADSAVVVGAIFILYLRWKKIPLRILGK